MVQRDNRRSCVLLSWMFIIYLHKGASMIICPDVAELHSHAVLSCPIPGTEPVIYHAPLMRTVASCLSVAPSCIISNHLRRFNGAVVNKSHSYLEISDVQLSDEGSWKCEDQNNNITTNCSLELSKTPTCKIENDLNTDNLNVDDKIKLSVRIENYYCSRPIDFLLHTGNTTEELVANLTTKSANKTDTYDHIFNVTKSHFGSVELLFKCKNIMKRIKCDGVQRLLEKPPSCDITSEGDKRVFHIDEEISLTVQVENYYCSDIRYELQTGTTKATLNRSDTGRNNESNVFISTFRLIESQFGPLELSFVCNGVRRSLLCGGIKKISKRQLEAATIPDTQANPVNIIHIIAGTTAAAVILITVIIIVVCVVKKHHKSAQKNNRQSAHVVNTRSKNNRVTAPGAYEDIGDVNGAFVNCGYEKKAAGSTNDVEMVLNEGYISCDDVKTSGSRSCDSGLPGKLSTFRPENLYTQANEKPKVQN